jgi:hypothetical protein
MLGHLADQERLDLHCREVHLEILRQRHLIIVSGDMVKNSTHLLALAHEGKQGEIPNTERRNHQARVPRKYQHR